MRLLILTLTLVLTDYSRAFASPQTRQIGGSRIAVLQGDGRIERKVGSAEVGPDGRRHEYKVRTEQVTKGKGKNKRRFTMYHFEYIVDGVTSARIGSWSSESDAPTTFEALALRLSEDNHAYAVVKLVSGSKKERSAHAQLYRDGRRVKALGSANQMTKGILLLAENSKTVFLWRKGGGIYANISGKTSRVVEDSMYDWSAVRLSNGEFYILSHNYQDRSFELYSAIEGQWDWKRQMLDAQESGWQHSVAVTDDQLYVLYYFFRNSFNKGLQIAQVAGQELIKNQVYHREKEHNTGWEPLLGISSTNKVGVRFLENVLDEDVRNDSYESPSAMLTKAEQTQTNFVDGWEDRYRDWFFFGGPEGAYQFWTVIAPQPDSADVSELYDSDYAYNPATTIGGMFEARWGSTNLGINYTQNLLGNAIEDELGTNAKRAFNFIGGFVGFDRLFLGHDVRVTVGGGEFTGEYKDQNGTRGTPTELYNFELGLLNQYRIRYGLTFRQYGLYQPIYKYEALAGETEFQFVDADVVDADVRRFELFVGYSKLDYVSKYENKFSGLDLEVKLGGGLSVVTWDDVLLGGDTENFTVEPAIMGQLRLVYLYFKRFYGLHGLGTYFRAGYGVDFFANGISPGPPGDREDDPEAENNPIDSDETAIRATHFQIQHGPFIGFGIVY